MAGKDRSDELQEVFTDLNGNVDDGDNQAAENFTSDPVQTRPVRRADAIKDEELEVDDENEGPEPPEEDEEQPIGDEPNQQPAEEDADTVDPRDYQLLQREAENVELRKNTALEAKQRNEAALVNARARHTKAIEDGDSAAVTQATEDMQAARNGLDNANHALVVITGQANELIARAKPILEKIGKGVPVAERGTIKQQAQPEAGSRLAPSWLKVNPWFNDPKHAADVAILRGIDQAMAIERKLDKNKPEWFQEMAARFNRIRPGLARGLDGKPIATGQRTAGRTGRNSVMPNNTVNRSVSEKNPKNIKLDAADLEQMRTFKMDPSNMDHRRAWLSEKRAAARSAN
jgi:hypothetical protein